MWILDLFFFSLLSGRILIFWDEIGVIFIDRDLVVFVFILNFFWIKELDLRGVSINVFRYEVEFYGIILLVRRFFLCEELECFFCGSVFFYGYLFLLGIFSCKINNIVRFVDFRNGFNFIEGEVWGNGI